MNRGMKKSERLHEMERLYTQRAYSDNELAERLGVDRTTVYRDRIELAYQAPFAQDGDGRWRIDRSRYLSNIRLNLNESVALYLAARRASQQTRISQPHVASALEKLALALKQPMTSQLVKEAKDILVQKSQPERVKILERIAQAWVEGHKLRLAYQGLKSRSPLNYVFSPYLIEPSPWGDGTYLIGYSDVHADVATFKVERIASAFVSGERFELPKDFDRQVLLRHAWGIWSQEGEPETVTLRFAPGRATRRLKESIWHPLEQVSDCDDGGCIWKAPIAEWQEMLPWVRGWGADVEVLAPEELRETLMGEVKVMAEKYGWFVSSQPTGESSTLDDYFGG